ncbi:EboA domain-containing protein [Pedobacter riviphilus]|uniref:EboA domain-containing protein n=1 Tax=Pedobacter riviphilus TaxID=2766984 RepID=A0ABX6TJV8_9SPHI|nr:EboA domain-containing protein [Pedobacter riviphilus]QNR85807.1 EboA domain-containing protein [Pedobacter riviphilus]
MRDDHMKAVKEIIASTVKNNISVEAEKWLEDFIQSTDKSAQLAKVFVMLPRKTGKLPVAINNDQQEVLHAAGFGYIRNWTIDRLSRVWLLAGFDLGDKERLFSTINPLFLSAEVNEAVALYSALPFLAHPEIWVKRCAEGIRSNIGSVLEAIMENNPYPSENLDEAAWNQLVLKAFFTEKNINLIIGLDKRANLDLALTLIDYAKERWAAGRKVNPQLWRLVGKFINAEIFDNLKVGLQRYDQIEQRAIALAVSQSDYQPAKDYINTFPELKLALSEGNLNWDSF